MGKDRTGKERKGTDAAGKVEIGKTYSPLQNIRGGGGTVFIIIFIIIIGLPWASRVECGELQPILGRNLELYRKKTQLLKISLLIKSYPEFNTGGGRGGGQTLFVLAQRGLEEFKWWNV